jgi:hypothetical protein
VTFVDDAKALLADRSTLVLLVLITFLPKHSWATSEPDVCRHKDYPVNTLVCSDHALSTMEGDLQELLANRAATLDSGASKVLTDSQAQWFSGELAKCITFRLTDLADPRVGVARRCIAGKYEARRRFLTDMSTETKPQAPYLLSGFERAMLVGGEADSTFMKKSLNRVFAELIAPGFTRGPHDEILFYFAEAVNGYNPALIDIDDRYLSGWTFQRHAGFQHYYTIVDLKTGEVILASSLPGKIRLSSKTCVSKDFKRYANHRVHEWLYDSATESERASNGGGLPPNWSPLNETVIATEDFESPCRK